MTASNPNPAPSSYSQEDIQNILQIALAHKTDREEWTREQLWEMASELNIKPSDLVVAEQNWQKQKLLDQRKHHFDQYRREEFKQKATRYLIINTFLMAMNFLGEHALSWSLYVLLFWGTGLSLSAWKTYMLRGEAYEEAFQRWNFKHEIKQSVSSIWDKIKQAWQT